MPTAPGQPRHYDDEYVRHGVVPIFLFVEPLTSWLLCEFSLSRCRRERMADLPRLSATRRGRSRRITLPELVSWSDYPDPGVRCFSGTATYAETLDVPAAMLGEDRLVTLDLGKVKVMAEVLLNGKALGILWKRPFAIDITRAVRLATTCRKSGASNCGATA